MRKMILLCFLLAGLASHRAALAHEEVLAGSQWVLSDAATAAAPELRFEAGRVSGSGGCNRFGGRYEQQGSLLRFAPLAATRMGCPPEVMQQEQAFFAMLTKVRRLDMKDGTLTLLDGAGAVLARFMRRGGG